MKWTKVFLAGVVFFGCTAWNFSLFGSEEASPSAPASDAPRLISPRSGMPAVAVGDDIFIFGGFGRTSFLGDIERYNVKTGAVTLMKTALKPRCYHTAEVVEGKIYITGGIDDHNLPQSTLEIYDPVTDSATSGPPLPTPRYFASSAVVDGRIYFAGGSLTARGDSPVSGIMEVYDPRTRKWARAATMPVARQTDLVAYNGKIYAVGGYDARKAVRDFQVYDPKKNRWKALSNLPFSMSAHHGAVLGGKLITFGDFYELDRLWTYDFARKEWDVVMTRGLQTLPSPRNYRYQPGYIFSPRRHSAVVAAGERVYVIGGNLSSTWESAQDTIESFSLEDLKNASRK